MVGILLWNTATLKTSLCFLKVTVLQVVRSPAIAENFSFVLDPSLSNVTVYVTGDSPVFTLYSPTGEPTHLGHCVLMIWGVYFLQYKNPDARIIVKNKLCFSCLSGVSQSDSVADGPLGSILTVGNLRRVTLNSDNQTGIEWKISINSATFYSLKVTGMWF